METFVEISLILGIATVFAGIMRLFKQPLILAYILTGVIVGPQFLNLMKHAELVEVFSTLGISILLFIVGLGLSPKVVRQVGKVALITGLGQILFTTAFGFLIAKAFGYSLTPALYIAIALTFSSTIIILKLLSDKRDLEKLYGRVAIGFLLVQDVAATLILLIVSAFASSESISTVVLMSLLKGFGLTVVLYLVSAYVLPKLGDFFAQSNEFLFLFSVGWGFGMATLFQYVGFSIEIGALIAGVTLSATPYSQEISTRLRPLRDFFIIMFFVVLGSSLVLTNVGPMFVQALLFSLFVLFGNPLIVIILMGMLGYNRKTGFQAGLTVAQISEFSLILVVLGLSVGHVTQEVLSLVTLVGLITIAGSTYMILYSEKIYPYLSPFLGIFEKNQPIKEIDTLLNYEVVLFGCDRVGYDFIDSFKDLGSQFLCIDYNPDIVKQLQEAGVNCAYGDVEDAELLDELAVDEAKLVVSTIPDHDSSLFLLKHLKKNPDIIVILLSNGLEEALELYDMGADYVLLPHFVGGRHIAQLVNQIGYDTKHFNLEKTKQVEYLRERASLGHAHPGNLHRFEI
jgi:Kef-type K+ transport system membrane component KefB